MKQSAKRYSHIMNILVYNGPGVSNLQSILYPFLKSIAGKDYDIIPVDSTTVINSPWENSTSLFVMPGGRDLPYLRELEPHGTRKLLNYVQNGGKYLGICAGAYFASSRIEFEVNRPGYSVVGDRPLKFFPGTAVGSCSKNFSYQNELGAAVLPMTAHLGDNITFSWNGYVNGGPYFEPLVSNAVNTSQFKVLATYDDAMGKGNKPSIVLCNVGKGKALLTGTHFEVGAEYLETYVKQHASTKEAEWLNENIIPALKISESQRNTLISHLLELLDIKIDPIPLSAIIEGVRPTPIFFYSSRDDAIDILHELADKTEKSDGAQDLTLKDQSDTFMISFGESMSERIDKSLNEGVLSLHIFTGGINSSNPNNLYFNVMNYFSRLKEGKGRDIASHDFGAHLLVANVTTSTQTILEKNFMFLETLPSGTVFVAAHQTHGKGRGRNSWVSQKGCLQFSLKLNHPSAKLLLFIQYLFSLSIVEAIKSIPSLENLPIHIKWPNDIYANTKQGLKKIGGVLITSQYIHNQFTLVIGCGLNINNPSPTYSLLKLLQDHQTNDGIPVTSELDSELVLARIVSRFQDLHEQMCKQDSFEPFFDRYHSHWLHSNQKVSIVRDGTTKNAHVVSIDDNGFLRAKCIETGEFIQLQPDGNSFDMMQGLITTKFT